MYRLSSRHFNYYFIYMKSNIEELKFQESQKNKRLIWIILLVILIVFWPFILCGGCGTMMSFVGIASPSSEVSE